MYLLCVIIKIPCVLCIYCVLKERFSMFYVFTVCYNKDSVCSMYLLCVIIKIPCVLCIYCVLKDRFSVFYVFAVCSNKDSLCSMN